MLIKSASSSKNHPVALSWAASRRPKDDDWRHRWGTVGTEPQRAHLIGQGREATCHSMAGSMFKAE